jgi:molybdenum cofactor cytidylyltransferase
MNLAQALRLVRMDGSIPDEPACLALVGAGGKSTALFQISRELSPPIILTATTHLAVHQLHLADYHLPIQTLGDLNKLPDLLPGKTVLVTGPRIEEERVSGIDREQAAWLNDFAGERQIPLLIEADGSRQRPLKAPAEHEPAIPPFARQVVSLAGLSALGKPCTEEWVHRPQRFADLSGLSIGSPISVEALVRVLAHPEGGLKNIPPRARRIVLLTQAITEEKQALAKQIGSMLLPAFHAVLAASLHPGEEQCLPDNEMVFSVQVPVGGILLAAGGSSRMGHPKQLLTWRDEPLVRHAARNALQAGLSPLVIVIGAHADQVRKAVMDLPVRLVDNPEWDQGQSSSVKAGLEAMPPETGAAIFLLVDQPYTSSGLIRSLVDLHSRTLSPLVAPRVGERRANPVLFDRQVFPDLMAVQGDMGGRKLFSKHPVSWLDWPDEKLLLDIDTEEDYQRLRNIPLP